VGFNLLFDLGRIASHWGEGRNHFLGEWSLGLWGRHDSRGRWKDHKFHPRLNAKPSTLPSVMDCHDHDGTGTSGWMPVHAEIDDSGSPSDYARIFRLRR
jgi:hypothetical protein